MKRIKPRPSFFPCWLKSETAEKCKISAGDVSMDTTAAWSSSVDRAPSIKLFVLLAPRVLTDAWIFFSANPRE